MASESESKTVEAPRPNAFSALSQMGMAAPGGGWTSREKVTLLDNIAGMWATLPAEKRDQVLALFQGEEADGKVAPDLPSALGVTTVEPVARAPENVFQFRDCCGRTVGWRNTFSQPVEYDVLQVPDLLDPSNDLLATIKMPAGKARRFLVIDAQVQELYGSKIAAYFAAHNVETHSVILQGEEYNKRPVAVDSILEACCVFGLHRREPIIGIGGGVVLDIVGLAANLYRRGVPYIRVPTTLLALVDASVGVKNGVDYPCVAQGPQKNRMGSFFAPVAALLDKSFIATQDERNIINGMGEIMKLALVRDARLFEILEAHGERLVREQYQGEEGVADEVIERSIQVMLEELGPNLWEARLDRCVDYGHTFSKILEMFEEPYIMHGEAVNVDGWLCVLLSLGRGYVSEELAARIYRTMRNIGMPTIWEHCTAEILWKGLEDAVEHRNGKQRLPLITSIGQSVCVNDITLEELRAGVEMLHQYESKHVQL